MRVIIPALMLCCLLVLAGCDNITSASVPPDRLPPEDGVSDSLDELNERMGYPVKSLYTLPAGYVESGWECTEGAALTVYTDEETGASIFFYMWDNNTDYSHSFDTDNYTGEVECCVGEVFTAAFGDDGILQLCLWSDEGYSYIIYLENGVNPTIFQMILDGIT